VGVPGFVVPRPSAPPVVQPVVARPDGVVLAPSGHEGRWPVEVPLRSSPRVVTGPATSVGIQGTGGTVVQATPADLLVGPVAEISNFVIVSLDAGVYG
jgi:hypothetical protein